MDDGVEDLASCEAGLQNSPGAGQNPGWRALFSFTTTSHLYSFFSAIALSVASGIVIPVLAVLLGKLFDHFTEYGGGKISAHDLVHKVSLQGLYLVALGSASILLNAGYFGLWLVYGELQAKCVRDTVFDGLLQKDMEWFDMRKTGVNTLLSRLQSHTRELQLATSQPLGFTVQYIVTTLAAFGLAFYYSWDLTLVTLSSVPFAALVLGKMSRGMQLSVQNQVEELTKASKVANNAISSIDTVKCYNGQNSETWQYSSIMRRAAYFYLRQAKANALQIGFVRFITLSMFVQGFWYGTHLVITGKKTPGGVLTAFWACLMATQTVEQIFPQTIILEKGRVAGAYLRAMLNQLQSGVGIVQSVNRQPPECCKGEIKINGISFGYPTRSSQLALDQASFTFSAHRTTFIVGRSGSGKSTIASLLLRFYNFQSGNIVIDGNPIHDLDIHWLRSNITLIEQKSMLFNETLFKNVALGRKDHDLVRRVEMKESIKTAYLQHTISDLPQGLDTTVGNSGSALSGGQKQRVAIARARLRDTPILVVDEGTSALDQISRTIVMSAIRRWRRGRTTIIITHHLSQILENDFVYVMDEGRVVQEGFRRDLEKKDAGGAGAFERLLQTQAATPNRPDSIRWNLGHSSKSFDDGLVSPLSPASPVDQIHPTNNRYLSPRLFIPSVFSPALQNAESGSTRQSLMPPPSPIAFPMHRMSLMTAGYNTSRYKRSPIASPLPTSSPTLPARRSSSHFHFRDAMTLASRRSILQRMSMQSSFSGLRNSSTMSIVNHKPETLEREEPTNVLSMKDILSTVWPALTQRKHVLLLCGFACAAIHAVATPMFSWVFAKLLGTFFLPQDERTNKARTWSLSVFGVAIGDSIASYFLHYLLERSGQAWIDNLRIEAMNRILDQPREWFDTGQNKVAELTECLDRNAEEMRHLLGRFAAFIFVAFIMLGVAIIWSLMLSWRLTLVGLASALPIYALSQAFEVVSGKWESKSNDASAAAHSIYIETFGNLSTVRALTLEAYFRKKYVKATDQALNVGLKRSLLSGIFFGLSDSTIIFIIALIFYYGAVLASSNNYSVQDILTVFAMLLFSIANAANMIAFIPQISSSKDTATRLLRLAKLPFQQSHEHSGNVRLARLGSVAFNNVSFSYPSRPGSRVLSSMSFSFNPHSSTALVGSSGCGKSTIASLLLGLYPPDSGTISIASFPLEALHLHSLRSMVSIVPQSPTVFPATVAQNIAYALPEGSPLASLSSIRAAAKCAGIDEFFMSLPQGYNTLIGEGGSGLSGGQVQRLAIARAVVRRPELLVLDEATSALDGESASVIHTLVKRLEKVGIGCLIVTHSTEMMRACAECVVLSDGRVLEKGPFRELIARKHGELKRLIGG